MRSALVSLPGVEKDSISVNIDEKLATFKVKDAATFQLNDAVGAVDEAGFKATVARTGSAVVKD